MLTTAVAHDLVTAEHERRGVRAHGDVVEHGRRDRRGDVEQVVHVAELRQLLVAEHRVNCAVEAGPERRRRDWCRRRPCTPAMSASGTSQNMLPPALAETSACRGPAGGRDRWSPGRARSPAGTAVSAGRDRRRRRSVLFVQVARRKASPRHAERIAVEVVARSRSSRRRRCWRSPAPGIAGQAAGRQLPHHREDRPPSLLRRPSTRVASPRGRADGAERGAAHHHDKGAGRGWCCRWSGRCRRSCRNRRSPMSLNSEMLRSATSIHSSLAAL